MALTQALAALREHWQVVRSLLDPAAARDVDVVAAGLLAAPDRQARRRAALELLQALDRALPRTHPVRVALAADEEHRGAPAVAELDAELAEFRRLLSEIDAARGPTPEEIIAAAKAILLDAPSFTPQEVRALGGEPDSRGLLRLPVSGDGVRLPRFQFGATGQPVPVVLKVNEILNADSDPWGAADWWLRGNGWLGAAPADLVSAGADEDLIAAALAERGEE